MLLRLKTVTACNGEGVCKKCSPPVVSSSHETPAEKSTSTRSGDASHHGTCRYLGSYLSPWRDRERYEIHCVPSCSRKHEGPMYPPAGDRVREDRTGTLRDMMSCSRQAMRQGRPPLGSTRQLVAVRGLPNRVRHRLVASGVGAIIRRPRR